MLRNATVRKRNNIKSENGIILPNLAEKAENRVVTFRITKLERAGLLKGIVGMYHGYTGGLYLITPAFKRLMKLIQYANEPTFNFRFREADAR
jgi:hypothetical protein